MGCDDGWIATLQIILSNGESCTAGSAHKVNKSHTFDQNKKITKVECIIHKLESVIMRINFYSGQETLVKVGWRNDKVKDEIVKMFGGRVESFEIAADERLIGAELDSKVYKESGEGYFMGVTWIKMKVTV